MELSWAKGADIPMKITPALSSQLSTVTFVATILVVMCHCDDVMASKDEIVRYLGGVFSDANVANFFFLSGFFVARHFGEDGSWKKSIVSRLRSLGVPYLAWCVAYLAVYCLIWCLGCYQPPKGMFGFRSVFGVDLLTPPIDFALWYIKTLFYFIIVSPLFFALQYKFKAAFPLIALSLLMVKISPFGSSPYWGCCFNLVGFVCFLMGAEVAFSGWMQRVFLRNDNKVGIIWLFCWIIAAFFTNCTGECWRAVLHPFYILFAVFCLQRIIADIPWRVSETLARSSFVIYAAHLMILKLASPLLNKMLGRCPILCFLMLMAVAVCSGIAITVSLRSLSRRTLALLTGGRG